MTVTYTAEVASVRGLGCFLKLLLRWRGSIYKLVWMDLVVFLSMYFSLNLVYRLFLSDSGKILFENIVRYCAEYSNLIPLSFVLGFYVSIVMTRWWAQYTAIPFPDPLAVFVSATVHGLDERGRVMRRTIMRYVCLCVTMMFTMISPRVKKRFPTLDHFVDAGLLQASERDIIADLNIKFPNYSKHWMPLVWAASIISTARKEGRIRDDFAVKTVIDELNKFRGQCGLLLAYDTMSVPLVYTQVVTLAVYSYFLTTLMAHQWVEGNKYKMDLYFPVFTTLQFFFYVGWLKVAESLINPFGDDDDDFEVNWMIDRNLNISYLIVDEMHHEHPELVRDQYWDEVFPQELPHTIASQPFRESQPLPSTANIAVSAAQSLKKDDEYSNTLFSGPIAFTAEPAGGQTVLDSGPHSTSISRNNSVTSMLKRIFTKSNVTDEYYPCGHTEMSRIITRTPSTKKVSQEVIEEVEDEQQNTVISMRKDEKPRPTVLEIFGAPALTQPIDIPHREQNARVRDAQSSSVGSSYTVTSQRDSLCADDRISIGSSDSCAAEFEALKRRREQERLERLRLNFIRSSSLSSTATNSPVGMGCEFASRKSSIVPESNDT